ncbi:MAG: DUF1465 family protein [Rhodospirillales bacterium]|nr:DUF1465 family protein [Rhodospirillales bacterium]
MALLVAARNYLAYARPADAAHLPAVERLRVNGEAMRVTARLSQIMAWLLAQKAVHAGEISREKAATEFSLPTDDVCLAETDVTIEGLPNRLRELLEASRRLYVRVLRLDELARRAAG